MPAFSFADWLSLLLHFMTLSLMAVGGAVSTAPEMHRYVVDQRQWLSAEQFNTSIALAQAAPGPNLLFVTLVGWQIGWQAAGPAAAGLWPWFTAAAGACMTLLGMLLPSAVLTYTATRWLGRNQQRLGVRAFKAGLTPLVIGLLFATAWILSQTHADLPNAWRLWLVSALSAIVVWRTRWRLIWLIGAGAVAGALGWV